MHCLNVHKVPPFAHVVEHRAETTDIDCHLKSKCFFYIYFELRNIKFVTYLVLR